MKRLLVIGITALALVGCGEPKPVEPGYRQETPGTVREISTPYDEVRKIYIWVDPDTGCEFYATYDGLNMQRFNADGTPRCRVISK